MKEAFAIYMPNGDMYENRRSLYLGRHSLMADGAVAELFPQGLFYLGVLDAENRLHWERIPYSEFMPRRVAYGRLLGNPCSMAHFPDGSRFMFTVYGGDFVYGDLFKQEDILVDNRSEGRHFRTVADKGDGHQFMPISKKEFMRSVNARMRLACEDSPDGREPFQKELGFHSQQ